MVAMQSLNLSNRLASLVAVSLAQHSYCVRGLEVKAAADVIVPHSVPSVGTGSVVADSIGLADLVGNSASIPALAEDLKNLSVVAQASVSGIPAFSVGTTQSATILPSIQEGLAESDVAAEVSPPLFKIGDTVVISGLVQKAELNGQTGTVISLEKQGADGSKRIGVSLTDDPDRQVAVRKENLTLVLPTESLSKTSVAADVATNDIIKNATAVYNSLLASKTTTVPTPIDDTTKNSTPTDHIPEARSPLPVYLVLGVVCFFIPLFFISLVAFLCNSRADGRDEFDQKTTITAPESEESATDDSEMEAEDLQYLAKIAAQRPSPAARQEKAIFERFAPKFSAHSKLREEAVKAAEAKAAAERKVKEKAAAEAKLAAERKLRAEAAAIAKRAAALTAKMAAMAEAKRAAEAEVRRQEEAAAAEAATLEAEAEAAADAHADTTNPLPLSEGPFVRNPTVKIEFDGSLYDTPEALANAVEAQYCKSSEGLKFFRVRPQEDSDKREDIFPMGLKINDLLEKVNSRKNSSSESALTIGDLICQVLAPMLFEAVFVCPYSQNGNANNAKGRRMRVPLRLDVAPINLAESADSNAEPVTDEPEPKGKGKAKNKGKKGPNAKSVINDLMLEEVDVPAEVEGGPTTEELVKAYKKEHAIGSRMLLMKVASKGPYGDHGDWLTEAEWKRKQDGEVLQPSSEGLGADSSADPTSFFSMFLSNIILLPDSPPDRVGVFATKSGSYGVSDEIFSLTALGRGSDPKFKGQRTKLLFQFETKLLENWRKWVVDGYCNGVADKGDFGLEAEEEEEDDETPIMDLW